MNTELIIWKHFLNVMQCEVTMNVMNEKKFTEICKEIAGECDCHGGYCFFKHMVEHQHPQIRTLVQCKILEKQKWIWSQEQHDDIGWNGAWMKWAEEGYAKTFADLYNEDDSISTLHKKILARMSQIAVAP